MPARGSQPRRARRSRAAAAAPAGGGVRRWSQDVTDNSRALILDAGVFTWDDPKRIARSLKRSAEKSSARKTTPFRSALSMLTFYVNRAGRALPAERRRVLQAAKDELRKAFGRT